MDALLTTEDIPGEHKLVYLARRVMEADARMVESILYNTKYSNLSNESKSILYLPAELLSKTEMEVSQRRYGVYNMVL